MKWIIFAAGLAGVVPLVLWLRSNPSKLPRIWVIIGALPMLMDAFPKHEIAILGVPGWPGFVQGFNVSILDLLLLAVYFVLPPTKYRLPFKFTFAIYIAAVLVSMLQAPAPRDSTTRISLW